MNICIFVHSLTGNTLAVAERIEQRLTGQGHAVRMHRLLPIGQEDTNVADIQRIQLQDSVCADGCEAIIFGCPVRGFSVSPVMEKCFSLIGSLEGQRVACFVTQSFPYAWMGGNRAIRQMMERCAQKGCDVCATGIVNWKNQRREQLIEGVVAGICNALKDKNRQQAPGSLRQLRLFHFGVLSNRWIRFDGR